MATNILRKNIASGYLISSVIIALFFGCQKLDVKRVIKIETQIVSDITSDSAKVLGEILDLGENEIIEYGHCWSTSENPTIALSTKTVGEKMNFRGVFTSHLYALLSDTTYYVRAYATNALGTTYGKEIKFQTLPSLTSIYKNLISYWSIDEKVGSVVFDLYSDNNLTVHTGVDLDQAGLLGRSAFFQEINSGLTTEKKASSLGIGGGTSKSVCMWIKPDESIDGLNSCGIINLGSPWNQEQFGIKYFGNPAMWMFDSWYGVVRIGPDNNKLADGKFHLIVVTYNNEGHKLRTYLDGEFVMEDTTKILNITDDYGLSIGIGSQGSFIGNIDEVGLWSRALSDAEVELLYNSGNGIQHPFEPKSGIFTDFRDGHKYKWVKIGSQVWMSENLAYLSSSVSPSDSGSDINPYYYVYGYNGSSISEAKATDNYKNYGVLYNWKALISNPDSSFNGTCPEGWHIPSESEWTLLIDYLGGEVFAGGHLKEIGNDFWLSPNTGADNSSGFTARAGGIRFPEYGFDNIGYSTGFWSAEDYGVYTSLEWSNTQTYIYTVTKEYGFYVRCVRNN